MQHELTNLVSGIVFGEGPRWRHDRLWFSDMHGEAVYSVSLTGDLRTEVSLPGRRPSGLGFLPDGSLLIVSMLEREVLHWDGSTLTVHGDLSGLEPDGCNDMYVAADGTAYVGAYPEPVTKPGRLYRVDPDGSVAVAASDMNFPNGMVQTPDGTLIVAESLGRHFTEFDIDANGNLCNRRVYAACPGFGPDGICLDADGAVWASMTLGRQFQRIAPGGEVLDVIDMGERMAIACALGGPDRRHLFLLSALDHSAAALAGTRLGRIDVVEVPVPGAGRQ